METGKQKTIVYIEDDQEMINLVTLILSKRGYEIKGALNGQEGIDLINRTLPDLILLDLMMPDIDGWDVFKVVKSQEKTQNIPVIVITAKAQPIDRVLGLHVAKVDDYLSKPFRPQELADSIQKIFDNQAQTSS
jgi:DNA-binding response OmpR family regulator